MTEQNIPYWKANEEISKTTNSAVLQSGENNINKNENSLTHNCE